MRQTRSPIKPQSALRLLVTDCFHLFLQAGIGGQRRKSVAFLMPGLLFPCLMLVCSLVSVVVCGQALNVPRSFVAKLERLFSLVKAVRHWMRTTQRPDNVSQEVGNRTPRLRMRSRSEWSVDLRNVSYAIAVFGGWGD